MRKLIQSLPQTLSQGLSLASSKIKRADVPEDVSEVTSVVCEECEAESVGIKRKHVESIWRSIQRLYKTGMSLMRTRACLALPVPVSWLSSISLALSDQVLLSGAQWV